MVTMSKLHDLAAEYGTPALASIARVPSARMTGVLAGRMRLPAEAMLELLRAGAMTEPEAADVWWGLMTDGERKMSQIVSRWCRENEAG